MAKTMTITEFKSLLAKGKVCFAYYKVKLYTRAAIGTTNPELIPEDKLPKGTGKARKSNDGVVKYYDLEKEDWRSFVFDNLICVGNDIFVNDIEMSNGEVAGAIEKVAEKMKDA